MIDGGYFRHRRKIVLIDFVVDGSVWRYMTHSSEMS